MLGLKRGIVELCAHDAAWEQNAAETIDKLKAIFGGLAVDIQHVGSTAVAGIMAKPIIDIAVAANDLDAVARLVPVLEQAGFLYRRQETPDEMLFVRGDPDADTRTHHIHVLKSGCGQWQDLLAFRDYLSANPDAAKEYEAMKLKLMRECKTDRPAYTQGKTAFVGRVLRQARARSLPGGAVTGERSSGSATEALGPNVIHILGASGSGTTTLGKAIGEQYGFRHIDADDYFWLPTDPPYTSKRELLERQRLLGEAIASSPRCVISGSLCGWGDMFIPRFELVILVETPTRTRIERLKQRERGHFGQRILPGGDMYANHMEFLAWAARYDTAGLEQRSRALHAQWLGRLACPLVKVDGTMPAEEILAGLEGVLR